MNKRRVLAAMFATVLALCISCSTTKSVTGDFSGSAKGFGGDVSVTLSLENGKLANAAIVGDKETSNIGGVALKQIEAAMNKNKTVNVDAVAGATYTSKAISEAVDIALSKAGMSRKNFAKIKKQAGKTIEKKTKLVIIGAGGAGLTLGNSAIENGVKDIIILEKMGYVGGATANAGGIDAGMSKLQSQLGMNGDSVELIYNDIIASGTGHNKALSRIMAENQGATLDWLIDVEKAPFKNRYAGDFPEHTVQRFFVCEGGMSNCMNILADNFTAKGGKIEFNTRANSLIQDNTGKVIGVEAETTDGDTVKVFADAVVIATGGYGANEKMISEKKSDLQYAVFYGVHSSFGDGHAMGQAINAKMLNMGYAKLYPNGISQPGTNDGKATPMPTLQTVNGTGAIFVNKNGERFINETLAFADIKNATCLQPDEIMYLVMDQAGFDLWSQAVTTNSSSAGRIEADVMEKYFETDSTQPTFTRGTLEEAAKLAHIDSAKLAETVKAWNATVASGSDKLGRKALHTLDATGKIYIIEQKLRFATTLGGFDITPKFEVQTEDGKVVPGLYAIGECVGGPNGTEAIPGSMACWAITSGRVLGIQLGKSL